MNDAISFVRYSPYSSNDLLTGQLVECFRDVFADRPWNEWLKCQKCEKYWGLKDVEFLVHLRFQHCDIPLVDFWPRDSVIADLHHEITSDASCWLAMQDDRVIGFCWGYPISPLDLENKLGACFGNKLDHLLGGSGLVAYQDEVGVVPMYRGQKIAKRMVRQRLDDFLEKDLQVGVVRTRQYPEPSETFLWYTEKLGYELLYAYPDTDGRVVLFRPHKGMRELLV